MAQSNAHWASVAPLVAERLLGEPTARRAREWRWGRKGSRALNLESGIVYDYELGKSFGVVDLVQEKLGGDRHSAVAWLSDNGYLAPPRAPQILQPLNRAASDWSVRNRDTAMRQSAPIGAKPPPPVAAWLAERSLWREDVPLPPSMRWLPAKAAVFWGNHQGAGAIVIPLAPLALWIRHYPDYPPPTAVQLINIGKHGEKSLDRPKDYTYINKKTKEEVKSPGQEKRFYGAVKNAAWTIGDVTAFNAISICEGAADGLAIASHEPEPVCCAMRLPNPPSDWIAALAPYSSVLIWADDEKKPAENSDRSAGITAARSLARGLQLENKSVNVRYNNRQGKDPADLAREYPHRDVDADIRAERLAALLNEGASEFEAARLAAMPPRQA